MRVLYLRRVPASRSPALFDEIFYMEKMGVALSRRVNWTERDGVSRSGLRTLNDSCIIGELESISQKSSVEIGPVYIHFEVFEYDDQKIDELVKDVSRKAPTNGSPNVKEFLDYVESL